MIISSITIVLTIVLKSEQEEGMKYGKSKGTPWP